jgi:hypothetical protein
LAQKATNFRSSLSDQGIRVSIYHFHKPFS